MWYELIVPEPSNLQNLWDLWVNCTECCWCKWSRACGAVEWSKWRSICSSHRTSDSRDQKLLAGSSIPKLLACLHGFCICDFLALSLQCTIIILGETIVACQLGHHACFPVLRWHSSIHIAAFPLGKIPVTFLSRATEKTRFVLRVVTRCK